MIIKFANGAELAPIVVTGASRNIHGVTRDVLSFVFSAQESMDVLDNEFTETACETIMIVDENGNESLYKAYTVRVELKKNNIEITPETPDAEAVFEERIIVSMAQRTYAETQLKETREAIDLLLSGDIGEEDKV